MHKVFQYACSKEFKMPNKSVIDNVPIITILISLQPSTSRLKILIILTIQLSAFGAPTTEYMILS